MLSINLLNFISLSVLLMQWQDVVFGLDPLLLYILKDKVLVLGHGLCFGSHALSTFL